MTDLVVPNSFTSGTSIVASEVNANFDAVKTLINTTGVPALQDSVVSTAKLANGAVTNAKLAADAADTTHIQDAAVTAAKLASGSVTAVKLAAVQSFSASGAILSSSGQQVRFTGSTASQTLTLPAAASGLEYYVHNNATVPVTIARAGSDTIGTATSIVLAPGARVWLVATSGSWYPHWAPGEQVSGGYNIDSTDSSGAGDKASFTIVGDGVTPVRLRGDAWLESTGGAGSAVFLRIRDGASGTGSLLRGSRANQGGTSYGSILRPEVVIAAFSGSKTIYLHAATSSGTVSTGGANVIPTELRATWAPGCYTANP